MSIRILCLWNTFKNRITQSIRNTIFTCDINIGVPLWRPVEYILFHGVNIFYVIFSIDIEHLSAENKGIILGDKKFI